jgi:phytoene dehydrogenase-like protein
VRNVVIVGAGLAGLCCARALHRAGVKFTLIDSADAMGGRIRTDIVDGFRLDRGFQVFLPSYPEAKAVLDYPALRLKAFEPGSLVRLGGKFHELSDPWRRPLAGVLSAFSPVGSLWDKLKIAKLRSDVLRGTVEDKFTQPETTTLATLQARGFSPNIIDRFFRPFLGGIFLDPSLNTSSRMFEFVFRMFSTGLASLPELGMEEIPKQLARDLPLDSIRLNTTVMQLIDTTLTLSSGETLTPKVVVLAGPHSKRLLGEATLPQPCGVTCLYFRIATPLHSTPILVLNGDGTGPINNLCVPSTVSPRYAPEGSDLLSVTVLGTNHGPELEQKVRTQLKSWYGEVATTWAHLRTYSIPFALPTQHHLEPAEAPAKVRPGVFVCGDHRHTASINGAMVSGRRAAEAVLAEIVW